MAESGEGSPGAAQGAPADEDEDRPGFLGRLMSAFAPADEQGAENGAQRPPETPIPGLSNLRRMRIEDVAIPKVEIHAVAADIGLGELVAVFRETGLTRLPVFEGTLDSPLGLVHLKDFALQHGFNGADVAFDLRHMLRPLLYAPPSMPIGVLLQKMQSERRHMALVIDEYGGVDGLVTIEDLIEQVVGEIEDEHDVDEEEVWVREKPGVWLVEARAPLDEFEAEIGQRLVPEADAEEVDTMGGLVFMLAGRVPVRGEVIRHPAGHEVEVVDADPRRIKRLRLRLVTDGG